MAEKIRCVRPKLPAFSPAACGRGSGGTGDSRFISTVIRLQFTPMHAQVRAQASALRVTLKAFFENGVVCRD